MPIERMICGKCGCEIGIKVHPHHCSSINAHYICWKCAIECLDDDCGECEQEQGNPRPVWADNDTMQGEKV
jgi:hypothetical protein